MRTRFYSTSTEIWAAMLAAIEGARSSVYLEMYIFEDHTDGYDFVALLEAQARAGVNVHIVLDAIGSMQLGSDATRRLTEAGVEVLYYSYWFNRTHRKLLIIDEAVAFLGGANIARRFESWDDLVVRVEGRVVRSIVRSFARAYVACGGDDRTLREHAERTPFARTRTWFVEHGLGGARFTLREHYEEQLAHARHTVTLVTPYLAPSKWLLAALSRALKRSVTIDILLPAHTDIAFMQRLNLHFASVLAKQGATVHFHPTMNHAKAMLVDDRVAVVGSHNLDELSFAHNAEASLFFENKEVVRALARILDTWKEQALPYASVAARVHWYDKLLAIPLRLMRPML